MTTRTRITEADWQTTVVDLAHALGWKVVHFRPGRTSDGWRTAVQYDGKGWPDLILIRDRVVFAELKTATGRLSHDQMVWLETLDQAGSEVHIWRPADFHEIREVLR